MCGRYVSSASRADLQTIYGISGPGEDLAASFNVAPTQTVPAVLERRDKGDQATVRRELKAGPLGLGAVLGEGSEDRSQTHKRTNGDDREQAGVPFRVHQTTRRAAGLSEVLRPDDSAIAVFTDQSLLRTRRQKTVAERRRAARRRARSARVRCS
jgi:hypothetical protein